MRSEEIWKYSNEKHSLSYETLPVGSGGRLYLCPLRCFSQDEAGHDYKQRVTLNMIPEQSSIFCACTDQPTDSFHNCNSETKPVTLRTIYIIYLHHYIYINRSCSLTKTCFPAIQSIWKQLLYWSLLLSQPLLHLSPTTLDGVFHNLNCPDISCPQEQRT